MFGHTWRWIIRYQYPFLKGSENTAEEESQSQEKGWNVRDCFLRLEALLVGGRRGGFIKLSEIRRLGKLETLTRLRRFPWDSISPQQVLWERTLSGVTARMLCKEIKVDIWQSWTVLGGGWGTFDDPDAFESPMCL